MNAKDFQPSRLERMTDKTPLPSNWEWLVNFIKGDALKYNTEVYRQRLAELEASDDENTRKALKAQLDDIKRRTGGFFPHAVMGGDRKPENVVGVSNHVMIDLDKIPAEQFADVRQRLMDWEYTFLLYTTYSGRGLRAIVRIDGEYTVRSFRRVWSAVNDRVEELCGVKADRQCGDITRFSGLAHDPEVYYNAEAALVSSEQRVVSTHYSFDKIVERTKRMVEARGCYYLPGNHNNYICRCMYLMNQFGVDEDEAAAWGEREFSDYNARKVRSIVKSCYRKTEEHGIMSMTNVECGMRNYRHSGTVNRKNGKLSKSKSTLNHSTSAEGGQSQQSTVNNQQSSKATPCDIRSFIGSIAEFRVNVISGQTEVKWRKDDSEWTALEDRDVASLWMRMAEQDMRTTTQAVRDVIESDFTPKFNPFADYFTHLPEWDGKTDHLALLADRIHLVDETESERKRLRLAVRRWMIAMVAGIFEPQTINHEILVLLGKQGNYKSTFFSLLLPTELQRYFYTRLTVMSKDKDDLLTLSQYAIIAYEEIDCLSSTALNHLKAEVTMRTVNERQVYRHFKECRPHIASFCATGNNVKFLTDSTGNRRWLAFEVESIDSPLTHPFDYSSIYSQVWSLYQKGEKYWYDGEEIDHINERNEHFSAPCLEEELISLYYCQPGDVLPAKLVSTAEILEKINAGMKIPLTPRKIGNVMKRLGYEVYHTRTGAKYRVHERTTQEIDNAKRAEISIYDQEKGKATNVQTDLPF